MKLHFQPWITAVLEGDAMRECSAVVNGLRFYTPGLVNGEAQTAYEQAEASGNAICVSIIEEEPDDVYVLTPNGEQSLVEVFKPLPVRTEADMRQDGTLPPLDNEPLQPWGGAFGSPDS